jgi:hypothetical protein
MALMIEPELPWDAVDATPSPSVDIPSVAPSPPPPQAQAPAPPPRAPPQAPPSLPPSAAAERARAAHEQAAAASMADPFSDAAPPFIAAKEIDPMRIGELEALSAEIHLVSPDLGDIFLVRQHSGIARNELTYREAATLRQMVDQFPGARVVKLRPGVPAAPSEKGWDA